MPPALQKTLINWRSGPFASRLVAATWGAAFAFLLILCFFLVEALTLFGKASPVSPGFLRHYADIPPDVVEVHVRKIVIGTVRIYLAVAFYFSFFCGATVFVWEKAPRPTPPRKVFGIVGGLFFWVMVSAAVKLLAVHPYAAEGIPWLAGVERQLRSWWTPGWAVGTTVTVAAIWMVASSFGEAWWVALRRGALLCCFFPLLGPSVSSLSVGNSEYAEQGPAGRSPPVILIGIDSLRPDHVSRWGGPSQLTPNLDAFLADAVEFTNAWTVVGRTHPSYVSLLTARTPDRHGVRYNRADPFFASRLPKTLGQSLIDAGYSTHYLTDDNMFSSLGLEHGFQKVGQPPSTLETYAARRFMGFLFLASLPARWTAQLLPALKHNRAIHSNYDSKDFSDAVGEALLEETKGKSPFFLVAHLCSAHFPGSQPGPEFRAYQPPAAPAIDYFKASLAHLKDGDMHITSARDERLRGLYQAGVRRADAELGRIFGHLRAQGLFEKAWVVVWSDHGESFTDRRGKPIVPSHGLAVDEGGEDLRIVLGIRPPGGRHVKVESTVSSLDIAPTLLKGLGLPALPGEREGRALQSLMRGEPIPEPILYAESGTHFGRNLERDAARYDFDLLRLYRFDPSTRELVTRRHFHDKLVINKQRMVQKAEFRLVYEPLADGSKRQRFFRITSPERPARDARTSNPAVFEELRAALEEHLVDLEPESLSVGVKREALQSAWFPWLIAGPQRHPKSSPNEADKAAGKKTDRSAEKSGQGREK